MKQTRHIPHHHPILIPLTRLIYRQHAYATFRLYYLEKKARCSTATAWHKSPDRPHCVLALARRRRKLRAAYARFITRQSQLIASH